MNNEKTYRKGLRNDYRSDMPWTEVLTKDAQSLLEAAVYFIRNGRNKEVIVATPDLPGKRTTLHKIAKRLGMRLTNRPVLKSKVIIQFDDQTISSTKLPNMLVGKKMLNEKCKDISKQKVDLVHQEVFGYNTLIDPLTYQGIVVIKSDENAKHDGREVLCPIRERVSDVVYQLLLDNTVDDQWVVDYRVPVIGQQIPLAYAKYKSHALRFTNEVDHATLHQTSELLSLEEQKMILIFCNRMGADFCELDVIRHRGDGKVYVIDLNKTPFGPPAGMAEEDKGQAIEWLTESFSKMVG